MIVLTPPNTVNYYITQNDCRLVHASDSGEDGNCFDKKYCQDTHMNIGPQSQKTKLVQGLKKLPSLLKIYQRLPEFWKGERDLLYITRLKL